MLKVTNGHEPDLVGTVLNVTSLREAVRRSLKPIEFGP